MTERSWAPRDSGALALAVPACRAQRSPQVYVPARVGLLHGTAQKTGEAAVTGTYCVDHGDAGRRRVPGMVCYMQRCPLCTARVEDSGQGPHGAQLQKGGWRIVRAEQTA